MFNKYRHKITKDKVWAGYLDKEKKSVWFTTCWGDEKISDQEILRRCGEGVLTNEFFQQYELIE